MFNSISLINAIDWTKFDLFKDGWFGSGSSGKFYNGPSIKLSQEGWDLIKFYIDNNHWLSPEFNFWISLTGILQNGWYAFLHGLTDVATMMMTGSLYLFKVIPDQLIHSDGAFHQVFLGVLGIGFALMTVSMTVWLLGYMRGKRENEMTQVFTQVGVAAGSIILLPIIVGFLANMVVGYLIPSVSGINQSSSALSLEPLKSNTIDMVTWAERGDGFGGDPDHSDLTKFNGIGKSSAATLAIPDYTTVMDSTQKTAVKQYAEDNGNLKGVENVFNYKLANGSFIDNNGDVKEGYGLEKLKEDKGVLSALGSSYKRFKVQNFIASVSYIALIFTAFGMSIKVAKAAMNGLSEFIAMPLAMGRDIATSGEHGKKSLMMIINTVLGVVVDVFMLGLFVQLQSTIPNQVANYLGDMHNLAATTAKPYAYLLTLVMLCFAIYNGSSAIERTFGLDNGANGMHKSVLPMFTAGAMLGSSLKGAGSRIGDMMDAAKMKKLTEDKTKEEAGGTQGIVNNGKALAQRLSGMFNSPNSEDNSGSSETPLSDEEGENGQVNNGTGTFGNDGEDNGTTEDSFGPNSPDPVDGEQETTGSEGNSGLNNEDNYPDPSTTEQGSSDDNSSNQLENTGTSGEDGYGSMGDGNIDEPNDSETQNNHSLENSGLPNNIEQEDSYPGTNNEMENNGKDFVSDDNSVANDNSSQPRNDFNDQSRVDNNDKRTESHINETRQQPNHSRTNSANRNTSVQQNQNNLTEDRRREMNRLEQRRQMRARNRQSRKQVQSGRRHRLSQELIQANEAVSRKSYQEPKK